MFDPIQGPSDSFSRYILPTFAFLVALVALMFLFSSVLVHKNPRSKVRSHATSKQVAGVEFGPLIVGLLILIILAEIVLCLLVSVEPSVIIPRPGDLPVSTQTDLPPLPPLAQSPRQGSFSGIVELIRPDGSSSLVLVEQIEPPAPLPPIMSDLPPGPPPDPKPPTEGIDLDSIINRAVKLRLLAQLNPSSSSLSPVLRRLLPFLPLRQILPLLPLK